MTVGTFFKYVFGFICMIMLIVVPVLGELGNYYDSLGSIVSGGILWLLCLIFGVMAVASANDDRRRK
ncbi:MAG: hypothetical protein ACXABY_03295 [Candidatus Thorarchaeota archaeon]|jgi:hypothetical protein